MGFVRFMESTAGRVLRVVAGLAMIVVGVLLGGAWLALAVVGVLPVATGLLNVCLIAPLFHAPMRPAAHR